MRNIYAQINKSLYGILVLAVLVIPVSPVTAEETYTVGTIMTTATFRWDNENWFTLPHPKIATFSILDDGSAYGLTETGISFLQYNVPNEYGIRIQRFEIQDHYHYVIDGEIAYTTAELSARLAEAYTRVSTT